MASVMGDDKGLSGAASMVPNGQRDCLLGGAMILEQNLKELLQKTEQERVRFQEFVEQRDKIARVAVETNKVSRANFDKKLVQLDYDIQQKYLKQKAYNSRFNQQIANCKDIRRELEGEL